MKFDRSTLLLALGAVPGAVAWGGLGHMTSAFLASKFVSNSTEAHFKELLRNEEQDYLATVATWADSIRYTRWGKFSKTFHFIDAHDDPPYSCNVDFERDCKGTGCVINALANYTSQSLDTDMPDWLRAQAAKFVIHFVGDLHQPLHNEDASKGGNGIYVKFDGKDYNLHHVWDTSIAEKWLGQHPRKPHDLAQRWANQLAVEISDGVFAEEKQGWLKDLDFSDPIETAMSWSRECNALVCTHVFPKGPAAIRGEELGGDYFEKAGPVVEKLVAKAGYRMAKWLDHIADEYQNRLAAAPISEDL